MKFIIFGAAALLFSSSALAAPAIPSVTFNGDTTGGPTWQRPLNFTTLSNVGNAVTYQAIPIQIVDSAGFTAEITSTGPGFSDTTLLLYVGSFDPNNQFINLVAVDDDGGSGLLSRIASSDGSNGTTDSGPYAEGNYIIVVDGFNNSDFGTYVLVMNGVVVSFGPSTAEQLDELKASIGQSGRTTLQVVSANVQNAAQNSFEARTRANGQGDAVFGEGNPLDGNVHVWANGSVVHSDSAGRSYTSPLLQIGADVAVNEFLVVGLSGGIGEIESRSVGYTFDATQTLIQPYIGWNTGDWHGTASVVFGWIDYDTITTPAGAAGAKGELLGFSADVARDFMIDATTTVSPFVAVETGRIKLTATSGTLAGAGIASNVDFTEARLGANVSRSFDNHTLSLGVSADHFSSNAPTALSSGEYDSTGWSASARAGYSGQINETAMLDAGVRIGGIGNDSVNYSGSLNLSVKF